jgi:hypothetical protein
MTTTKIDLNLHEQDSTTSYLNNDRLPAVNSQYAWTGERVKELEKCRKNILYFAQNYFFITTLDEGKVKIKPYKAQKRILKSLEKQRFVCLLASRQCGKTTMMTIFALWMACFRGDYRVIIVANKESTAKNILKRIKLAYEYIPNWIKPTVKQWDVKEVVFGNDSSIGITTTTSTAARGDTANCIIIDEMAFIPYNFMEEFWRSIIPVVSSSKKSKIFSVSTPNGTGNQFYNVYSNAERNVDKDWKAERIDWWEVPGRDEAWKRKTIASLGSIQAFNQEFGNEFISTGESAINAELITKFRREATEPKIKLMDGAYQIWNKAQPKRIYIMGADVGEGIGSTASTVQVLDVTDLSNIKQVACYRDQYINPYNFSKVLYEIAGQWGSPYIYMERNNVGTGVLDNLYQVFKYDKIACHVPNSDKVNYERLGIYSHTNTKLDAVTNMRYWLNEVQSVEIYDITTIQEFETFVRYPNGTWKKKHGEDLFDDMIMALIWGLYALKNDICEKYYEILSYDERGKPLKIQKSLYDEEEFFGSQSLMRNFNDAEPLPTFVGMPYGSHNDEYDLLQNDGWSPLGR